MRRMRHLKPREIQGCQLALDASIPSSLYDATSGGNLVAADGAVARWEDQSGNARHVTQATGARQPARRVASTNGGDSLEFGGDDYLERASQQITDLFSSGLDAVTCITVQRQDAADARNSPFSIAPDSNTNVLRIFATYDDVIYFDAVNASSARISVAQPSGWDGSNQVLLCTRDGANASISANNQTLTSSSSLSGSAASATAAMQVGADRYPGAAVNAFDGHICALAVFSRGFSGYLQKRISHAAQRKWRIAG